MTEWKNLDALDSFKKLKGLQNAVDLKSEMSGENGANRVRQYSVKMAAGMNYNYAAKQVNADVLQALEELASEAQLVEKYRELYEGAVINTGEKRLVLHQLTRGQLGADVVADGVNKREFYVEQQNRIAERKAAVQ
jgi:glucose-6-phosphate isomerase